MCNPVLVTLAGLPMLAASLWGQLLFQQSNGPARKDDNSPVLEPIEGFEDPISALDFPQISAHAGLYLNKAAHPEFANTVLVTTSNSAYSRILQNWRCKADKLGLDYIVLAFDRALWRQLGPSHSVLSNGSNFAGEQDFRKGHFNEMSCMKLEIVRAIVRAGFDVVFSDPDNVFITDPFASGVSLGDKIRSGHFDYVYLQNRVCIPFQGGTGKEVAEANTGFYYVSGRQKPKGVQGLFSAALSECQKHKGIDDQTNFWNALRRIRQGSGRQVYGRSNFACANLCLRGSTCWANKKEVLSYCDMDPRQHVPGLELRCERNVTASHWAVTYHANFVVGIASKIRKLDEQGLWDQACAGPAPLAPDE